jgi:uncharacterized membrane protein YbhN (UPF0104 family)
LDTLYTFSTEEEDDRRSKKISPGDLFVSFGLPLIASSLAAYLGVRLNNNLINVLATSLSIFVALLFNLLLLVYDLLKKENEIGKTSTESASPLRRQVLKEVYANISFSILASILALLILLIASLGLSIPHLLGALSFLVLFLVMVFILTLFMILKRIHNLLFIAFERR